MFRIIVDPSNNNLGFSISDGGDLWRTIDGNSVYTGKVLKFK